MSHMEMNRLLETGGKVILVKRGKNLSELCVLVFCGRLNLCKMGLDSQLRKLHIKVLKELLASS